MIVSNSECPIDWNVKNLQDVMEVNSQTLGNSTSKNLSIIYISIDCVEQQQINWKKASQTFFSEAPGRARRVLENGDILISTVRPNLKSFAVFEEPYIGNWIASTGFAVASAETKFSSKFYFYQILSDIGAKQFHSLVVGSNYPAINEGEFRKIKLFEAPLLEQKAIAAILSTVDESIEAVKISINSAERLKKSFIQNLLTGKLKPDGTWRDEGGFYNHEKFGKVPEDWIVSRFKDFSILQRGKDLTDNDVVPGDYPVVKSNGVQIYHDSYFIEPPGVITGRSGTIGKVFYVTEKFWAHNTTLYVKDFKGNYEKFIYYLILLMDFRQYYAGTTVPTLNRNDIHRLLVALPKSYQEQVDIVKTIERSEQIIIDKQIKLESLNKLKKSLMQNLLTGKVRVDVDKINKLLDKA